MIGLLVAIGIGGAIVGIIVGGVLCAPGTDDDLPSGGTGIDPNARLPSQTLGGCFSCKIPGCPWNGWRNRATDAVVRDIIEEPDVIRGDE